MIKRCSKSQRCNILEYNTEGVRLGWASHRDRRDDRPRRQQIGAHLMPRSSHQVVRRVVSYVPPSSIESMPRIDISIVYVSS